MSQFWRVYKAADTCVSRGRWGQRIGELQWLKRFCYSDISALAAVSAPRVGSIMGERNLLGGVDCDEQL